MRRLINGLTLLLTLSLFTDGQTTVGRLGANLPKPATVGAGGGGGGLLQQTNFQYVGSFLLPSGAGGTTNALVGWGNGHSGAVTYYPAGNGGTGSLFITCGTDPVDAGKIAEVSIPVLVAGNSPSGGSSNIAALNRGALLQDGNYHDIVNGKLVSDPLFGGHAFNFGLLVYGGKLYGTASLYYDGAQGARVSMFRHGLDLTVNDTFAWETVRDANVESAYGAAAGAGMFGGYLGDIPSTLQSSLGGPAFAGLFGVAIVGRTSQGPSAFSFDPAQIGSDTPSGCGGIVLNFTAPLGTRLNATAGSTTVTSEGGAIFPSNIVGTPVHITSGTHWIAGTYTVAGFTNASTITLDRDPTDGTNATLGIGDLGCYGSSAPVAAHALLYYPSDHTTLGAWGDAALGDQYTQTIHTYYTWSDFPAGAFFEDRTFAVPEMTGIGHALDGSAVDQVTAHYGPGVTDWALNGTLNNGGAGPEKFAYDLAGSGEGQHAWPYSFRVLLYDTNNLAAVHAGGSPWVPIPYAKFDLPMPFDYYNVGVQTGQNSQGFRIAYDRVHRNLYVVQTNSLDLGGNFWPMVHVYHITASGFPIWLCGFPLRRRRRR